jgi:hypothetical protein
MNVKIATEATQFLFWEYVIALDFHGSVLLTKLSILI